MKRVNTALRHFHFDKIDSTQNEIFRLFEKSENSPFCVTADEQTAGRGRMQRVWNSEKERSLILSLGVEMPATKLLGLSLIVGLAVREALDIRDIFLKWPNDLMLKDKKVGGILVESRSHGDHAQLAIGIGVNFLDLIDSPYSGIQKKVDALLVANLVLQKIKLFSEKGFKIFKTNYESVMWKRGEVIRLAVDGESTEVKAVGVSDQGLLVTETDGKLIMNDNGEIEFE